MSDCYQGPASIEALAEVLGRTLERRQWVLTTAESCTGGGIAAAVTAISGSSSWFQRSYVTYSNGAKLDMLGVPQSDLLVHGAVSYPVVAHMAAGALTRSGADLSVAVSGIAGPGGGSREKPVGTVFFAWCWQSGEPMASRDVDSLTCRCRLGHHVFSGDRQTVRLKTQFYALLGLLRIGESVPDA